MKIVVVLNGTNKNLYEKWGLDQNPFPQTGVTEYGYGDRAINSLAKPIKDHNDIKIRLAGFSAEFINLCLREFVKGKVVRFQVSWPDKHDPKEPE